MTHRLNAGGSSVCGGGLRGVVGLTRIGPPRRWPHPLRGPCDHSHMAARPMTPTADQSPSEAEIASLVRYWNAANYLTVAQIYLCANPLLREALQPEHIKPRLLGHWGTSPGLNLVYAHLNRLIRRTGARILYVAGPGHGGPAVVANVYLEGTYS